MVDEQSYVEFQRFFYFFTLDEIKETKWIPVFLSNYGSGVDYLQVTNCLNYRSDCFQASQKMVLIIFS
jgi:hypothetical protein